MGILDSIVRAADGTQGGGIVDSIVEKADKVSDGAASEQIEANKASSPPSTSDGTGSSIVDSIVEKADKVSGGAASEQIEKNKAGSPPATSPSPTSPSPSPSDDDADEGPGPDARANLEEFLSSLNLGSMTEWAWNMMVEGHSFNVVLQELRKRPEYQARFPAMDELRAKGRAIDEGGYIQLERQYTQIARTFGLPETFYDQPDDFAGFIANEMSPVEFEDRLALWQQVARDRAADPANANVLQQMKELYGISADSGDFLAMVIDPERATNALEKRVAAARTAGAALTAGFGALSREEAERIGSGFMGAEFGSFDREGAREGFRTLRESRQLFTALPGRERAERNFSREEQFGAVFDRSQSVLEALEDQAKERVALFRRGGSFASGREGISGLGRAD